MLYIKRYLWVVPLFLAMTGCHRKLMVPAAAPLPQASVVQPILIPDADSAVAFNSLRYQDDVKQFYRMRHHEPFWLEKNKVSAKADSMVSIIKTSRTHGLLPQHYHLYELTALGRGSMDHTALVRLDVLLTDAFLSLANDFKSGRVWGRKIASLDSMATRLLVDSLTASGIEAVLSSREPTYKEYRSLKQALNKLLDTLNITERNFLMQGNTNDSLESHRLLQRMEINLDRWRAENANLSGTFVWINIPAYMFYVVEQDRIILESRVIVGAPRTPTPVFSSKIECFTVFPYWYMPRKIAVQEYLPVIKKDTSFISRNNFDVLDRNGKIQDPATINWKQYNADNFPFTLRQREGRENSLGIVKFVFDNPYAVFVHDTNARGLFKHKNRAYSHGCIRLEKAVEFSHYLIGGKRTTIAPQTLNKYLNSDKRVTISLLNTVPIHVRYFTCEVKDGELIVYPDIYKKDAGMISALYASNLF